MLWDKSAYKIDEFLKLSALSAQRLVGFDDKLFIYKLL